MRQNIKKTKIHKKVVSKAKSVESMPKELPQSASSKSNQAPKISTQDSPSKATKYSLEDVMEDEGSNSDSDITRTVTSDKKDSPKVSKKKTPKILSTGQNLNIDSLQIPRKKHCKQHHKHQTACNRKKGI